MASKQKAPAGTPAPARTKSSATRRSAAPRGATANTSVDRTAIRGSAGAIGPRANRTIAKIQEATRQVFLLRGYSGTTIDEITALAGVSRASFYTYFPSKRDVLLSVGATSAREGLEQVALLRGVDPSLDALRDWVEQHFKFLDTHGSFAFAWTQAAQEDADLRHAGMRGHLAMCREFGVQLGALVGDEHPDPTSLGLVAFSCLERAWNYTSLYEGRVDRDQVVSQVARAIWGMLRPVPSSVRAVRR